MTTQASSSGQREAWRPSLLWTVAALPTRLKLAGGLAVGIAALLVAGVPLTTFVPFAGLAACLGMHLFMGHGHGDHTWVSARRNRRSTDKLTSARRRSDDDPTQETS